MKFQKFNSKRNPRIALALSLIMPGLGQVYNGELTKGLSLFLIFAFTIPISAWMGIHLTPILWLMVSVGALTALGVYVFCVVDAFRAAKLIGENYQLGPHNRPYVYLALLFFGYFFVLMQLTDYTQTHLTQFFKVPSKSMVPNLLQGDHFFADKRVNAPGCKREIKHGDIGIFINPNERTTIYVKRIVGLPGDKIEISGSTVSVNGKPITGGDTKELGSSELNALLDDHVAYLEKSESGATYPVLWKKNSQQQLVSVTVPDGYVYLLGDNRDESMDSRKFGPIPLTDVVGIAKQVMFSASSDAGFRIARIGKGLDLN